jgi:hypothetical protein
MEEICIKVRGSDFIVRECRLSYSVAKDCQISIGDPLRGRATFTGVDLFECLKEWRNEYEKFGEIILCCGARVDVYVSRIQRQMGRGRKAYVLQMKKQAQLKDAVDIFDYASFEKIGSVNEQERFFEAWRKSL